MFCLYNISSRAVKVRGQPLQGHSFQPLGEGDLFIIHACDKVVANGTPRTYSKEALFLSVSTPQSEIVSDQHQAEEMAYRTSPFSVDFLSQPSSAFSKHKQPKERLVQSGMASSSRENAGGLMPAATPSRGAGLFCCSQYDRSRCQHVGGKAGNGDLNPKKIKRAKKKYITFCIVRLHTRHIARYPNFRYIDNEWRVIHVIIPTIAHASFGVKIKTCPNSYVWIYDWPSPPRPPRLPLFEGGVLGETI